MRRKKKKHGDDDGVKLNLAAMLDMAFQLLTFFILTFRPPPVEGQITLKLPKPQIVAVKDVKTEKAGSNENNDAALKGIETLTISVSAKPSGGIDTLAIGDGAAPNLSALEIRLKSVLADPDAKFEQVIVQVGGDLRYEELMKVIDLCTRQTLASGDRLTKISFIELPSAQ